MSLQQILTGTQDLFLTYGIKSITMDDIARKMGISKKTLYQYVEDKNDLVSKTMKNHLQKEKKNYNEISKRTDNAVEEMIEIGKYVMMHIRSMNPSAAYDLQKYYPRTWQIFLDHKNTFLYSLILKNIKKGIKQGLYRNDIDPDIVAKFYTSRSEVLLDQSIFPFPEYTTLKLYAEYLKYHIRAIASEKGFKCLAKQKL